MLLTREEIWQIFRISRSTLLKWEKNGILLKVLRLPDSKHRRYYRSEIEQVLGMDITEAACE